MDAAQRFAADLAAAGRGLVDQVDQAADDAARLLATAAQRGAPRRTGRLAASVEPHPDGSVTVDSPYGRVIHDGWAARHIRAQPFLADAAARVDWPGPYVDAVGTALDHIAPTY